MVAGIFGSSGHRQTSHTDGCRLNGRMSSAEASQTQLRRMAASAVLNHWQQKTAASHRKASSGRWQVTAAAAATAAPLLQQADTLDHSSTLSLPSIRDSLIRQEDTIIFSLIERAQYAHNEAVYQTDGIPGVPEFAACGRRYSFLEYFLRKTEALHGSIRRYTSPDEQAFFPEDLPPLVLPGIEYKQELSSYHRDVNVNQPILGMYLDHLLPGITSPGNDNNYGSAAMYDVLCLQALSKRIHCGKFVAEAKFRSDKSKYSSLIRARDAEGIMRTLTNREVELQVLERVKRKAATYGQDFAGLGNGAVAAADDAAGQKILPETVSRLYEMWVMPLTKDVEVQYLMRRLEVE